MARIAMMPVKIAEAILEETHAPEEMLAMVVQQIVYMKGLLVLQTAFAETARVKAERIVMMAT